LLIALVTDSHHGIRGDNQNFAAYQRRFFQEIFYPKLDELGIKTIIHLGDIVDRRKYIEFQTAKNLREDVIEPAMKRGIDFHVIIGNHDTRYKGTNEVNVMNQIFKDFKYENLKWYSEPEVVTFDNLPILFMPWINNGNRAACIEKIANSNEEVLMGHLEIAGFQMYKGTISEHGDPIELFTKFDQVMSGHFHHRSKNRNITYLGAPYEMTWSDFNDPRGFHIYDTKTRELTFIENPLKLFHKVFYDDSSGNMESVLIIPDYLEGTYVKVIVKSKNNPYWFDQYIDKLEKMNTLNVQVVDDNHKLTEQNSDDIVDEAQDTSSIMKMYVSQTCNENQQKLIIELLDSLYLEALTVESV
jgi:hypothetical protein